MRLRRCLCLVLLCAVTCFGLFSVSTYAIEDDSLIPGETYLAFPLNSGETLFVPGFTFDGVSIFESSDLFIFYYVDGYIRGLASNSLDLSSIYYSSDSLYCEFNTSDDYIDYYSISYDLSTGSWKVSSSVSNTRNPKRFYPSSLVYIDFKVSNPVYDVTTKVVNGSSMKQFGFLLSPSEVSISDVDEIGFFARILNGILDLPSKLVDLVKALFMPSEAEVTDFRDKMDVLLRDRLGPAYEANDILEDFAYSLGNNPATLDENSEPATITLPALTVDLAGADFTFGGWEVQIIPDGFEDIVSTLKMVINMVCTLAFVNAMRSRLEGVFY